MDRFWIIPVISISLFLSGCDVINPKKPETKTLVNAVKKEAVSTASTTVADDSQPLPADIIVKVGGWALSTDEFNQRLSLLKESLPGFDPAKQGTKEAVLNELIRQQLLVKDAEDSGIGQSKDISEAVEDFRRTMLVQELANRLTKDVKVTEAEAQKYYNDHREDFVMPTRWKVREIVLSDESTAKSVLVQVLQGGNFAEIAKAQSKGKTAADGGALKPFTKAPFAAMQVAIANLEEGGTSSFFKGEGNNYYIVHVDEKKGGETKQFSEIKADLVAALTTRKQQETVLEHINQLSKKINVKVNKNLTDSWSK